MRTYNYEIDWSFIDEELAEWQEQRDVVINRLQRPSPKPDYVLNIALEDFQNAVRGAWGVENAQLLEQGRHDLTNLAQLALNMLPPAELAPWLIKWRQGAFGLATDPNLVTALANTVVNHPFPDPPNDTRQPLFYQALSNALAGLTTNNNDFAHHWNTIAQQHITHISIPPHLKTQGTLDAIDAIVNNNPNALNTAIQLGAQEYATFVTPTPDMRAGLENFASPTLSLIVRIAGWRGLPMPTNPYVITMID